MTIIDPSGLSAHAKAVAGADEQKVKDGYGRLELAIAAIANAAGVSELDRAEALEKLAGNAQQLAKRLESASSVEEAIAAVFGAPDEGGPAGALAAPNADVAKEVGQAAKTELGKVDAPTANSRAIVAKGVLGGSVELAGDQVKAIADLSAAETARSTAEQKATDAETEATKKQAVIDSIKGATRDSRVGNDKVIELSKLSPEARAALGL